MSTIGENFTIIGNFPLKPDLTIVYVGERVLIPSNCPAAVKHFFATLHINSPLLILLNIGNNRVYQGIGSLMSYLEFDKVVYLGTEFKWIFQMGLFGIPAWGMADYPHPKELIRSNIRNSHGRPIGYTWWFDTWYPAKNWIIETAIYLNTSCQYHPGVCSKATQDYCWLYLVSVSYIDIALDQRLAREYTLYSYKTLFGVYSLAYVALVPQGRPYNAIEMFTKPFAGETWVVLLLTLILIILISKIFPTLFKNYPVLAVLCGFERYNLHHASAKGKFALLPMMILCFLVFNAYRSKLIAFMTDKQAFGNIKTLNELAKSDLRIKADLETDKSLANGTLLGSQMVHEPTINWGQQLDGQHAYLRMDLEASALVALSRNYDFKMNRPKYIIINERISSNIVVHYLGMKSPLGEMFYYTQKVFFESGLLIYWQKDWEFKYVLEDFILHKGFEVADFGTISSGDLVATWIVLAVGLMSSLAVLFLEFLLYFFNRRIIRLVVRA